MYTWRERLSLTVERLRQKKLVIYGIEQIMFWVLYLCAVVQEWLAMPTGIQLAIKMLFPQKT